MNRARRAHLLACAAALRKGTPGWLTMGALMDIPEWAHRYFADLEPNPMYLAWRLR